MAIYCWGNSTHGELAGIEEDRILIPRKIDWTPPDSFVTQISCGYFHTLFLTSNGNIFSCGNNDNGQLGHELPAKRPQLITGLDENYVTYISCGAYHSLALSKWGQIFAWGRNNCGQLGLPDSQQVILKPKFVRKLVLKHIVQISCGYNHSLALTKCGELYSWGSNSYGQLGISPSNELAYSDVPRLITSLAGIPIAYIICGGNHSFVISKSGAVYGWGLNNCGQLGLHDYASRWFPVHLKTLRNLGVRYIKCGEEFSVFLTNDGGVFTCGAGRHGQLGHGGLANETVPRKIAELMGNTVTQIACGTRHTLAFVPSHGKVYGFGAGWTSGTNNTAIPQVILGPWVSPRGQSLVESENAKSLDTSFKIKQIFAGGDHSLVTCTSLGEKIPVDCRIYDIETEILFLTEEFTEEVAHVERDIQVDNESLLTSVEVIFKSLACINGSFLLPDNGHFNCTGKNHGIDLKAAERAFDNLRKMENESLKLLIWNGLTGLITSLRTSPADIETLRVYVLLPFYHEFVNSKNYEKLHTPFSKAMLDLDENPFKIVHKWWSEMPTEWFEHLVSNYKNVVAYIISFKIPPPDDSDSAKMLLGYDLNLETALKMLKFLHNVNKSDRKEKIHYEIFHWSELGDFINIEKEYLSWLQADPTMFCIVNYPFIFDAAAKTRLLQTDQIIQMLKASRRNVGYNLFRLLNGDISSEFLELHVTRENLVQDTLREIANHNEREFKKPLKVKFYGEEAEDAGGVRKEFFLLVMKDIFDPKYGMFKEYEDSRAVWFSDVTFESEIMYFLIGVVCGLAIYNFTIINLPFPLALYKKLLNHNVDLRDLNELSPTLANSMQQLLDYDENDFRETFDLRFEITRDNFGEIKTVPLKEDGENVAVTKENRQEFVDLYVDFIFNKSVDEQFKAFQHGFKKVCTGPLFNIFRPEELMAMVVGNEDYDWQILEDNCEYKHDYTSGNQTIKWFWEVFHNLSPAEKKNFLLYLTGSDRIPIGGMKAVKIFIQPTDDDKYLPVAHTCFNLLDLPRYKTKERLKYKLLQAIQQTQGFSIV